MTYNDAPVISQPQAEVEYGSGWRRWQILTALATIVLTGAGLLFNAGGQSATVLARLDRAEQDIVTIKREYARKEVVDYRLANIEDAEHHLQAGEDSEGQELQQILILEARKK